jgi:type II secretory pathway pseudopilin PulG
VHRLTRRGAAGFTVLELGVVVVIIIILVLLVLPGMSWMRARAQRIQCTANLRTLYSGAEIFLQQNGSWPQIPLSGDDANDDQDYARAWIAALAPFGPTQKSWICPTMQTLQGNPDLSKPENLRVDYFATPFDDKPTTPHRWPRQPWFAEAGDVHGNGNLIIFTDGSISDLKTVAAAAGAK